MTKDNYKVKWTSLIKGEEIVFFVGKPLLSKLPFYHLSLLKNKSIGHRKCSRQTITLERSKVDKELVMLLVKKL